MSAATDRVWEGSMPAVYDRCLGPTLFAPYAAELATRAAGFGARRVLEIAAGTGILTSQLREALPDAEITATDLNDAMVGYSATRVEGVRWQAADALDLPFDSGAFDLVACQFGVMFFPDKVAAFAEVARVLEPGGGFMFSTWDVIDTNDVVAVLAEAVAKTVPDDPSQFLTRIPHGYADVDQVRADVTAGGLEIEQLETVTLTGHAESARQLATGFCYGTPLRLAIEQRGALEPMADAIGAAMTARLGEGPVSSRLTAHVVTARH